MEQGDNVVMCPHPYCDEIAVGLAALALGAELTPEEQRRVLTSLATCARCRRRLDDFAAIARTLPLVVPEAAPPPALRERIVAAVQRTAASQPDPPPVTRRRSARLRWMVSRPALAIVLALMLLFGVAQQRELARQQEHISQQQAQIEQQKTQAARNAVIVLAAFGNDDALEGLLESTDGTNQASGRFFISPGAPAVALYVKHLPIPPAGMQYQAWIVSDGRTISAGTFGVNADGRAWRLTQPTEPLIVVERVFITLEPQEGSLQPSGPEYLTGFPSR
ncbi:MAG: anti-sigma factor [Chloroflexi bacterium]|nr:anti-sigma factor [Chloroflexota bacterium]